MSGNALPFYRKNVRLQCSMRLGQLLGNVKTMVADPLKGGKLLREENASFVGVGVVPHPRQLFPAEIVSYVVDVLLHQRF